jgi:hypothetical protein
MALRPYSTSPRRKLQMRGPNPRKNSVTFMPARRAITKWPSSCKKMMETRARTVNVHHHEPK